MALVLGSGLFVAGLVGLLIELARPWSSWSVLVGTALTLATVVFGALLLSAGRRSAAAGELSALEAEESSDPIGKRAA